MKKEETFLEKPWLCSSIAIKNEVLYHTDNFIKWKNEWFVCKPNKKLFERRLHDFYSELINKEAEKNLRFIQHILTTAIDDIDWEKLTEIFIKKFEQEINELR